MIVVAVIFHVHKYFSTSSFSPFVSLPVVLPVFFSLFVSPPQPFSPLFVSPPQPFSPVCFSPPSRSPRLFSFPSRFSPFVSPLPSRSPCLFLPSPAVLPCLFFPSPAVLPVCFSPVFSAHFLFPSPVFLLQFPTLLFFFSLFSLFPNLAILTKLHKDLRNYTQSVKALCHTNKVLCDTMVEVYEDEWTEQLTFKEKVASFEHLWDDYASSLNTRVQDPIQKQLNRFPDLRGKINKRGRKLVDLDNSRHVLENLTNQKKKDETKITKAQEDLTESQKVFDEINENLHIDLPEFYDDRIRFYSTIFQSLFAAESVFHSEMGQLLTHLIDVCEKLSTNHVALRKKRPIQENNHISFDSQEANQSSLVDSDENSPTNISFRKSESDVYENVAVSGQVQTTHPYTQGDTDELTFEAREIIYVIEPDNPEEMDEGWLMGIKQSDGAKGVFPENFTVKLSG
ncbi:AMPH [Acanthosepion pharaonis]|uniref:AMPH n=1 Tax=Acanthosepion pharaonis TaxID=158019 RepID=A0A812CF57_ACAPH|nr:AMPH [Sepia pharaonis]